MSIMRVKNNRVGMVTLPALLEQRDAKTGKLVHDAFESKRLMPGVNLVSEAYLRALGDNEMVNLLFSEEHGCLDLVDKGDPLIPEGVSQSLAGTNVRNAMRLISDVADPKQLQVWLHADSRETVHRAIAKRLEELEATKAEDLPKSPKTQAKDAQGK